MHINELNRQVISQLEQENIDLKNPLKPHLIKLDMQTKQVKFFLYRLFVYDFVLGTRRTRSS